MVKLILLATGNIYPAVTIQNINVKTLYHNQTELHHCYGLLRLTYLSSKMRKLYLFASSVSFSTNSWLKSSTISMCVFSTQMYGPTLSASWKTTLHHSSYCQVDTFTNTLSSEFQDRVVLVFGLTAFNSGGQSFYLGEEYISISIWGHMKVLFLTNL